LKKTKTMQVTYFSVVRYPTEKAYGVTIFYTMQALEEIGHQTLIISPENLDNFGKQSRIRRGLNHFFKKLVRNSYDRKANSKWRFTKRRLVIAILSRYAIPYKTEILWLRDPIVGLLNYRKPYYRKVVIEVHQPLKIFEKVILKVIERAKKLIIAPISKELYTSLIDSKFHFNKEIFMLSPMGVPKSFFKESDANNDQSVPFGEFKIGYVGGAYSAGVDHNISSLISCIDEFNSKSSTMKSSLSIFGLEADLLPSFQANFHKLIESKVLFLSVRQNHDTLVAELQKCNVFILPYPEGNYYKSSFPIKAMEYAALRRPILVTNTISHRNIFNTNEVWFYDPQSCSSLSNAMMDINKDSSNTNEKIKLAFNKSLNFTYQNRVENILKLI